MSNERYLMMESDIKSIILNWSLLQNPNTIRDWHNTPHTHPFTESFYVVDGKASLIFKANVSRLKANRLLSLLIRKVEQH